MGKKSFRQRSVSILETISTWTFVLIILPILLLVRLVHKLLGRCGLAIIFLAFEIRKLLGRCKESKLATIFLAFEAVSIFLDLYGKNKWGFLLAAFLLSAFGFTITIYIFFKDRTTAATRQLAERQLGVIEVVFSVVQLVTTFAHFILSVLGVENNFDVQLLPFAYGVITFMSDYKTKNRKDPLQNVKVYFPDANSESTIDLRMCTCYNDVYKELKKIIPKHLSESRRTMQLAYYDVDGNIMFVEDETWEKFCKDLKKIHVFFFSLPD